MALNSTRESTVSQDDKFTHTQNSEDDVGGDGQKRFSKDIHPIRRVSHFPFLSVHKICLLYNAMQFTFCTYSTRFNASTVSTLEFVKAKAKQGNSLAFSPGSILLTLALS